MKVRITKAPQKMAYGGQKRHSLDIVRKTIDDYDPDYNDVESRYHREADPRDESTVEVEGGEVIVEKGPANEIRTFKAVGPNHSPDPNKEGGVPMNLKEGSFVYSKRKQGEMGVKGPILKQFGKSDKDKKTYSFAQLADQYKVNTFYDILQNDRADNLQKATAAAMIQKYEDKLADLALLQESRKGFPQGVPQIAEEKFQKMMAYMQQAEQQKQMEQQGQMMQQQEQSPEMMMQQPPMMGQQPMAMYGYNMGGFVPDYSSVGDIYQYQYGGSSTSQDEQIMKIIAIYSQLTQKPEEEIIQALQSLPEAQQQEALQQMYSAVQQAMSQQESGGSQGMMSQQQDASGYYSAPGGEPDYQMQQQQAEEAAAEEEQQMRRGGLVRAYGGYNVTGMTTDPTGEIEDDVSPNMAAPGGGLTYDQIVAINPTLANRNPTLRFKTMDAGVNFGFGKNLERRNEFGLGLTKTGADDPYSLSGNLNLNNLFKRGNFGLTGTYVPKTGAYTAGFTYGMPSKRMVTRTDEEGATTEIPRSTFSMKGNVGRNDEGKMTREAGVEYTRNPKKATGVGVTFKAGATFAKGGSYSGTYDAASGSYFAHGGSFIPTYGDSSYNDQFGGEMIYDNNYNMLPRADEGFAVTSLTSNPNPSKKAPTVVAKEKIKEYEGKGYKQIPGTKYWQYKGGTKVIKGTYREGKPGSTIPGSPGSIVPGGKLKRPRGGSKWRPSSECANLLGTIADMKARPGCYHTFLVKHGFQNASDEDKLKGWKAWNEDERPYYKKPDKPEQVIPGTPGVCLDENGKPDPVNFKRNEKGECERIITEEDDLITYEEGPTTDTTTIRPGPGGGGDFGGGYYGIPFQNTLGLMAAAAYPPLYIRPFYGEPQGVIPRPTFYDPERELASAQESARALEQMASMVNPQAAGAMASYIQANAAKSSADTMGRYQNLNVGVANQFSPLQAQIFNSIAAQKREAADKRYLGEAIAAQQYQNAMRTYGRDFAKVLGEGMDAGIKLGQLYDTNPYYTADPFGRLRLKPGVDASEAIMAGTMAGYNRSGSGGTSAEILRRSKELKKDGHSDAVINNILRMEFPNYNTKSSSSSNNDDVAYGYAASAYPFSV